MRNVCSMIILVLFLPTFWGCAALPAVPEKAAAYTITDISRGLPTKDLWRQNMALADMDGDGRLDIVAPPPRKAPEGMRRPFIFVRDKDLGWREGSFVFPEGKEYGYGGIAVGDLKGDGHPDIVLAIHGGPIIFLMNDGKGRFTESPLLLPKEVDFYSRCVELSDLDGDGRLDIVALSEAGFVSNYKPKGLLVGLNKGDKGWDLNVIDEPSPVAPTYGDALAVGDITGQGKKDIVIAHLLEAPDKKLVWFGDGKGMFKVYNADMLGKDVPVIVRLGDIDGDGKDEVFFQVIRGDSTRISAHKWTGEGFADISSGLEKEVVFAFDLADLDGDGKKELILLSENGIRIYKYISSGWVEQGKYDIPPSDTRGAGSLRAGKNSDGSWLIAYNLGYESPDLHLGIRAFLLKKN